MICVVAALGELEAAGYMHHRNRKSAGMSMAVVRQVGVAGLLLATTITLTHGAAAHLGATKSVCVAVWAKVSPNDKPISVDQAQPYVVNVGCSG